MSTRAYPRLAIEPFGRQLITSGDLDPVYIALAKMEMDRPQLARWLVSYWLCYHSGAASWLSEQEGDSYWYWLKAAAWNNVSTPLGGDSRWPRAPERRHWRGASAVKSADHLADRYQTPLDMVEWCAWEDVDLEGVPLACVDVRERVEEHVGFGPWISFKVADMIDRVWGTPVEFSMTDILYDSPEQAALRLWKYKQGLPDAAEPKDRGRAVSQVMHHLLDQFKGVTAPPLHDRPIGLPEVETILCKWGSHMNGHYPLDNDLTDIRAGAEPWAAVSSTAAAFLHHFPLAGQVKAETVELVTA